MLNMNKNVFDIWLLNLVKKPWDNAFGLNQVEIQLDR